MSECDYWDIVGRLEDPLPRDASPYDIAQHWLEEHYLIVKTPTNTIRVSDIA